VSSEIGTGSLTCGSLANWLLNVEEHPPEYILVQAANQRRHMLELIAIYRRTADQEG
jgi:hypothetical protein